MTDSYFKDMTALKAMIDVLPVFNADPAKKLLALTNALLQEVYSLAVAVDSAVDATRTAYDGAFPDETASISDEARRQLAAIRMAGRGKHKSRFELAASLSDLHGNSSDANAIRWVRALRKALEGEKDADHHTKKAALVAKASAAGAATHDFCVKIQTDDPSTAEKRLLASAIDLFLPIAKFRGLSMDHVTTLLAMREEIRKSGGGGEGSSFWPSGYVSSSSSSSSGG